MQYAPIVLFVYNRPVHTQLTVKSLKNNELAQYSDLIIYSDGPKSEAVSADVALVRQYIKEITGFKSVKCINSDVNKGLANSIVEGVTAVLMDYEKVIVLEDDMITSRYFLKYLNDGLHLYKSDNEVISIHAYSYPVRYKLPETFFLVGADCWGWATWRRGWNLFEADAAKLLQSIETLGLSKRFDFNHSYPYTNMLKDQIQGKVDSWAIRWYASAFLKNKLTLYPGRSLVKNIGLDGSGTHGEGGDDYVINSLPDEEVQVHKLELRVSYDAYFIFSDFFKRKPSYAFYTNKFYNLFK